MNGSVLSKKHGALSLPRPVLCLLTIVMLSLPSGHASAAGGDISINAAVSPDRAQVGMELEYRVTVSGSDAATLLVTPPQKGDVFPPKEGKGDKDAGQVVPLYSVTYSGREERDGAIHYVVRLAYYRTGTHVLPELEMKDPDGVRAGYRLPSVTIDALNPAGEFQEIEGPVDVPRSWIGVILLAAGIVIAAGIAGFFIYRYVKSKNRSASPGPSALAVFLRGLDESDPVSMIDQGRAKEYAEVVSGLFRAFLSGTYAVDTFEMTTGELRRALSRPMRAAGFGHRLEEVMDFFDLWDLAKYAEFAPSREILERNLAAVRNLAVILSPGGDDV